MIDSNVNIGGVKQQGANISLWRAQVNKPLIVEHTFARHLGKTTIAQHCPATSADGAKVTCRIIRPHDDLATMALLSGIGLDAGLRADIGDLGILDSRIFALIVPAHQHGAATGLAAGVNPRIAGQAHALAQHLNLTALPRAGGAGDAACFEQRVLAGLENNLAVFTHHGAVGADAAALVDERAGDADFAALGDDLPQIQHAVFRGTDDHRQIRVGGINQLHAPARGQHHLALRTGENAAVFHIRCNQRDLAAAGGGDGTLVFQLASEVTRVKAVSARQKILVGDVQRGGDQAVDIDAGIWPEEDAVGVDDPYPPIGLQGAEDGGAFLPDYAVEHVAAAALLDETGKLARRDGKTLPVDDGVGGVGDGECIALGDKTGAAMDHLRADRLRVPDTGAETGSERHAQQCAVQCVGG